jgi:gluconokinase
MVGISFKSAPASAPLRCILARLTLPESSVAGDEVSFRPLNSIVIMGVAGSGKSTLGWAVAQRMGWPMIEGDDFHSEENRAKMHAGVPLSDADREGWLHSLARELHQRRSPAVLTCSALKRTYREILRAASPGLAFAFLDITSEEASQRLQARGEHFFSPKLLQSQFETLESPANEPGVLRLDAGVALPSLVDQTEQWLMKNAGHAA